MKKTCTKCKAELFLSKFYCDISRPDSLASQCKKCKRSQQKEYRQTEKGQATIRRYNRSEKGREKQRRSNQAEGRLSDQRKYKQSKKGRITERRARLKRKYNITLERYDELLEQQSGVCAICCKPPTTENHYGTMRLSVDHDHKTGEVRGLLCSKCNLTLGCVDDNKELLLSAVLYLERHSD